METKCIKKPYCATTDESLPLCLILHPSLLLFSGLWKNRHMVCDRYCPLPSKETWIVLQYQSHAGQTEFVFTVRWKRKINCGPCSFLYLRWEYVIWYLVYWWVERQQCCFAGCFSQQPYKSSNTQLYCAVRWSRHCLLQQHRIGWQWTNRYSAVCLAPFFFCPPHLPQPTGWLIEIDSKNTWRYHHLELQKC